MKKVYQMPEMEVLVFSSSDIITTSGFSGDEDLL